MSCPSAVVLLVGLPGSGKTSLCQQLASHQPMCRHICYDELLTPGSFEKWRHARDRVLLHVEEILMELGNCPEDRCILLVDDNFYYQSMRRMYYKMAKRHSIPTCIIYLRCSQKLAIQRVHKRKSEGGLFIEEKVINQMADKLEAPVEHTWESFHLLLDAEIKFNPVTIWRNLEELINSASKSDIFCQTTTEIQNPETITPSNLETSDLALRKLISAEMQRVRSQGMSATKMSQLAQQLNTRRKLLLRQLSDATVTEVVDQFRLCLDKDSCAE